MTRGRAIFLAFVLGAGFLWGAMHLMGIQVMAGDIYPEYSSLRSDAMGSKLLYDALGRLPGLAVTRGYTPLDFVAGSGQTVLVLGTPASSLDAEFLERLTRTARRGNRLVLALKLPSTPDAAYGALERVWNVRAELDRNEYHSRRLYFTQAKDWKVIERAGAKLLELERPFDKGTVVLCAESDAFANESMVLGERVGVVTAAIGPNPRVIFDEEHFGIAESGSVIGLARRYRLMGFALGLAICAALAIWKNASPFPAPGDEPARERIMARTSSAGLATLLARHIPARELVASCWQEWLKSNRRLAPAERVERAAAIVRSAGDKGGRPLDAMRDIHDALGAKGAH
jgi:hypothetical protein